MRRLVVGAAAGRLCHAYRDATGALRQIVLRPGDEVEPGLFQPKELAALIRRGIFVEEEAPAPPPPPPPPPPEPEPISILTAEPPRPAPTKPKGRL